MSKEVLSSINHSYELASYATPELRGLFHDWLGEIELRVIDFVSRRNRVDPQELAAHFKLTTESIIFILGKLAREGKVTMEAKGTATGNLFLLKREGS
jgi:hypothetical protein